MIILDELEFYKPDVEHSNFNTEKEYDELKRLVKETQMLFKNE